ncbi:MAG: CRTAC1 family protein, partial [Candidatus Poribacteria bacterium]
RSLYRERYAQINHLFKNNGDGTFTDLAEELGLEAIYSSRGSAVGDIDNNGDLDLVISNLDQPPNVMRNDGVSDINNWLNVKLIGNTCNHSAIGSHVILTAENMRQIREVRSGSSYLSQSDLRLHFGLGNYNIVDLEVRWPNGKMEEFRQVESNQFIKIIEGMGHLQHIEIQ